MLVIVARKLKICVTTPVLGYLASANTPKLIAWFAGCTAMKLKIWSRLTLLCALLAFGRLYAQGTISQVADFNTGPNANVQGSMEFIGSAVFFDGRTFYSASTAETGNELWVTDGTALNTRLFADLCPGGCESRPAKFYVEGTSLYFAANDGVHGTELWRLAAGAAAPVLLSDINPGAEGSDPALFERLKFSAAATTIFRTFFTATRAEVGRELWRLTAATNTVSLELNIAPGPASSDPAGFTVFDANQIGLTARTPDLRREVYKLNYASGTLPPTGATVLAAFGTSNITRRAGEELVTLGGTTNVTILTDIPAPDELWVTQGTIASSVRLQIADTVFSPVVNGPLFRTFFVSRTGAVTTLNVTDGTVAGTLSLNVANPSILASMGNRMLFTANTLSNGRELFSSDGTVAGTLLLKELVPGSAGIPLGSGAVDVTTTVSPKRLLLAFGSQLWLSDATNAGTVLISGGVLSGSGAIRKVYATTALESLLSVETSVTLNGEPFYNRGNAASNVALGNFFTDIGDSNPLPQATINNRLIVNVRAPSFQSLRLAQSGPLGIATLPGIVDSPNGIHFRRLWSGLSNGGGLFLNDGTIAGSSVISTVAFSSEGQECVIERNGARYFLGREGSNFSDVEIFRSDGTEAGTASVTNFSTEVGRSVDFCNHNSRKIVGMGSQLFFIGEANNSGTGFELYSLNAADQASLVADIRPGEQSHIEDIVVLSNRLIISANDGVFGQELWVSNGTGQGTLRLTDIAPGAASSDPRNLTRVGNQLYFTAFDPASGRELYVSDGTAAGTRRIADLFVGTGSAFGFRGGSFDAKLTVARNKLLFPATGSAQPACRLYETDGTAGGTRCAYDSTTNTLGPIGELVATPSGTVVFTAQRASDFEELRALSNRQLLTSIGGDIAPGAAGSAPQNLLAVGNTIYFQADDGSTGAELWRLQLPDLELVFRNGFV